MAEQFRGIMAGTVAPWVDETGNAWTMDIDAKIARLTCHFATPVATIELPTAWLVDVLERWRDHLIERKKLKQR
jgi:hypothetical protein